MAFGRGDEERQAEDDNVRLAEQAAAGDRRALNLLVERHLPELRAFVRLRAGEALRERESTSDLVQSTCRELLTHPDRFQFPNDQAFRRWLFTTATRKIADRADHYAAQRRVKREEALANASGADDERMLACYQRFSSPSHRVTLQDEMAKIERAFDHLSEEQREVVTLAYLAHLSRKEIAEQLGKSENAVRITLHRALARLAEVVQGGTV
jgi:RNA polymerase sigma-70 factor (ECF subfamily)